MCPKWGIKKARSRKLELRDPVVGSTSRLIQVCAVRKGPTSSTKQTVGGMENSKRGIFSTHVMKLNTFPREMFSPLLPAENMFNILNQCLMSIQEIHVLQLSAQLLKRYENVF